MAARARPPRRAAAFCTTRARARTHTHTHTQIQVDDRQSALLDPDTLRATYLSKIEEKSVEINEVEAWMALLGKGAAASSWPWT